MSGNQASELAQTISADLQLLLQVLAAERIALIHHDTEELASITAQKQTICQAIQNTVQAHPEAQSLFESDTGHKTITELALAAKESNIVNGKILHRSQQSVREILNILSGKSLEGLYGQSGQPTPESDADSRAFARA